MLRFFYCVCIIAVVSVTATVPQLLVDYLDSAASTRQLIVHFPRLGMVNRLRTIADWHRIAYSSNRTLTIIWDITRDCNTGFHDLFKFNASQTSFRVFDNPGEGTSVTEIIAALQARSIENNVIDPNANIWSAGHTSFVLKPETVNINTPVVVTSCDGVITMEGTDCAIYAECRSAFLASLQPHTATSELVESIYKQHFSDSVMIGVHYRAHDPIQDWAVVPPLLGTKGFQDFERGASVATFIEKMHALTAASPPAREAFDFNDRSEATECSIRVSSGEYASKGKPFRFFIASNSADAKKALSRDFPSAIFLGGEHRREKKESMNLALVEWLLLSKSALLLHTYGSTFAEQAAQVQNIPIIGIWENRLLHHSDTQLPFCGNQQYAKAYGVKQNLVEKVGGVFLTLAISNHFESWGLPDVLNIADVWRGDE